MRGRTWPGISLAAMLALPASGAELPARLHDTGLYAGDTLRVRAENRPFSPQYPLWSDGAAKRRWIWLPPGSFVDAARPDAWQFPVGTRLWKEFGYGQPVETRYLERLADGAWRFATYVWNEAGTDARLAPARGIVGRRSRIAPGGRYDIPAQDDCRACHEGGRVPVLGFSLLQLSPDRDPLAAHATAPSPGDADLRTLAAAGLVRNLPPELLSTPPRIPAATPLARASLGYLHGNCGHCHNDTEAAPPVALRLHQTGATADVAATVRSLAQMARYGDGDAAAGIVVARMRSRDVADQMPPLGSRLPDHEGLALVKRWIDSLTPTLEKQP